MAEHGQRSQASPLAEIQLTWNRLLGTWPDEALQQATALTVFYISDNNITGPWAAEALGQSASLMALGMSFNQMTGLWPAEALQRKSSLADFRIFSNQFAGRWPTEVLPRVRLPVVKMFDISLNSFTGTWPPEALCKVSGLVYFMIYSNKFTGTWPVTGARGLTSLQWFSPAENRLSGTWSPEALATVTTLISLNLQSNLFTGTWPSRALHSATALFRLELQVCHWSGPWPSEALWRAAGLEQFYMDRSRFTGAWPSEAMYRKRKLSIMSLYDNRFTGTWPADAYSHLTALVWFGIGRNGFQGTWAPESQYRLRQMERLEFYENQFAGTWSEDGLNGASALQECEFYSNYITGTWPAEALSRLPALIRISISSNRIAGTWPSSAFRRVLAVEYIHLYSNRLSGTWPPEWLDRVTDLNICDNRISGSLAITMSAALPVLQYFSVHGTHIEGALPSELSQFTAMLIARVGDTWIEGRLPKDMGYSQPQLSMLSLRELHLEGAIPHTLQRMSSMNASVVAGFGLRGLIPGIAGTLLCLSAFRNNLQGHLPAFRLASWSVVICHGNLLSCKIPPNGDVRTIFALALLGNHFQEPSNVTRYPTWIHDFEQSEFFVVSNRHARTFFLKCFCGAWSLIILGYYMHSQGTGDVFYFSRRLYGYRRTAQVMFLASFRMAVAILCAAGVTTVLYMRGRVYACMNMMEQLRLPAKKGELSASLAAELLLAAAIASQCRALQASYAPMTNSGNTAQPLEDPDPERQPGSVQTQRLWVMWSALCCCVSMPGALYAVLQTVPGFMTEYSSFGTFLVRQCISLSTTFLTVLLLPSLAKKLRHHVRQEELLSFGNFMALPLIPIAVACVCDAQCLGQWARFWQPCVQDPSPLDSMEHVRLPYFKAAKVGISVNIDDKSHYEGLITRSALCTQGEVQADRCLDAILDRLSPLVLGTAVHLAFSSPVMHVLTSRYMKLRASWVHLVRVWLLMLTFGSSIPLLCALLTTNLLVHIWLLFGGLGAQMAGRRQADHGAEDAKARLPLISLQVALAFAVVLQAVMIAVSLPDRYTGIQ